MHFTLFHLDFLYFAVSWVLLRWHQFFSLFMDKNSGLNWALSIVMLVVTARLLLFRMFIKQVHFQRRMQEMAPKLNEIKKKYANDRAAQQRETMELQRKEGFNPLAGCLPMFLQIPVFLGLYHVLRHLSNSVNAANVYISNGHQNVTTPGYARQLTMYSFSQSETASAAKAKLFGAPLAASFRDSSAQIVKLGGTAWDTRWVILPLLLISAAATFFTQLLSRANQTVAPTGTNAALQKVFLYVFPLGVLASGLIFNFPLGVLLYWFTSNTWTLAQQAYIIKFHPPTTPETASVGSAAKVAPPRPGQKPANTRTRSNQPAKKAGAGIEPAADLSGPSGPADGVADVPAGSASSANGTDVAPPAVPRPPRPGQRTNRPGTNRPAAKRPSQAKKRR
jgi:YidC/Oxa1 family membrane protein insertase